MPPKSFSVLPVSKETLGVEALFFVQRHSGTGPDCIIMHAVPLKDAGGYLKQLKETKISQQENPPGKK